MMTDIPRDRGLRGRAVALHQPNESSRYCVRSAEGFMGHRKWSELTKHWSRWSLFKVWLRVRCTLLAMWLKEKFQ
jgi:hypothetical protein